MNKIKDLYNRLKLTNKNSELLNDLELILNIDDFDINLSKFINYSLDDIISHYEDMEFPSISCGILTFNEERCIERCINSIYNKFDEIIILDSQSSDKTIDIVKKNSHIKIYSEPWCNDFSFHRNKIIDYSTSNWIYFIDADNTYHSNNENNARKIVKLMEFLEYKGCLSPMIYEHNQEMCLDGRKLFSLNSGLSFHGKVHEEPIYENGNIPTNIAVKIIVNHDGYNENIINQKDKGYRNLLLTKSMMEEDSFNPKWIYFFVKESIFLGENSKIFKNMLIEAIHLYEKNVYKRYYIPTIIMLCNILLENGEYKELLYYSSLLEKEAPLCIDSKYYKFVIMFFDIRLKLFRLVNSLESSDFKNSYSLINSNNDHIKFLFLNLLFSLNEYDNARRIFKQIETKEIRNQIICNINNIQKEIKKIIVRKD